MFVAKRDENLFEGIVEDGQLLRTMSRPE